MGLAEPFRRSSTRLPDDWTDLEIDLRIFDEERYVDAAVLLTQVNAQPYSKADWHWRLLVAHRFGHAAAAETVKGTLALLDQEGIEGEMVVGTFARAAPRSCRCGAARSSVRQRVSPQPKPVIAVARVVAPGARPDARQPRRGDARRRGPRGHAGRQSRRPAGRRSRPDRRRRGRGRPGLGREPGPAGARRSTGTRIPRRAGAPRPPGSTWWCRARGWPGSCPSWRAGCSRRPSRTLATSAEENMPARWALQRPLEDAVIDLPPKPRDHVVRAVE